MSHHCQSNPDRDQLKSENRIDPDVYDALEWAAQDHFEYVNLTNMLKWHFKNRPIKAVLELGLDEGGGLIGWSKIAAPDAVLCGLSAGIIDRVRDHINQAVKPTQTIHIIDGLTQSTDSFIKVTNIFPSGLDLLHIDADHTFEAAMSDWKMYAPLVNVGGVCIIHDLNDRNYSGGARVGEFWDVLKKKYCRGTWEISHQMGTGVVFRDERSGELGKI